MCSLPIDHLYENYPYLRIQPQASPSQDNSQSNVSQRSRPPEVNVHPICYNRDVSQQEAHQQHTCSPAEKVGEGKKKVSSFLGHLSHNPDHVDGFNADVTKD